MIIAYIGLDGSGKTYRMAEACQQALKAGMDCFGTTPFKGARLLENHRQLLRIQNANIFFDEWHQDLDAKEWYHLDPVLKHIITQHRKYNLVIHWSAQAWQFMDSFIRRETAFVWEHEALFRNPTTGRSRIAAKIPFFGEIRGLHRATKYAAYEAELKHRKPKILAKKLFFIRGNVYNTYDSYKKIMLTSKQISDEEILKITDPYHSPKITNPSEAASKIKHKRMIPDDLQASAASADKIEHHNPEAARPQVELNEYEEAEDLKEIIDRQENAENVETVMHNTKPAEQGVG